MKTTSDKHCALVIGLSSHGLTIARTLTAAGISVFAFEDNPELPGYRTASASVIKVRSLKSELLLEDLHGLRERLPASTTVVLFPTNDTTVAILARNIDRIPVDFRLSWASSANTVLSLLAKSNIELQSVARGLSYPRSFVAADLGEATRLAADLNSPYIVKPVTPQSGFKALKCLDIAALERNLKQYPDEFPILVQEWIEGTAEDLFFCALYLQAGQAVASFTGKKLESYPPALGQTTVAVSVTDTAVEAATKAFFTGTDLSGPASLELKRAPDGSLWVIEPTVGRTDFWLGLCTTAGFNLPLMEYEHAIHDTVRTPLAAAKSTIWFDSERDPTAPLRYLKQYILPGANSRQMHFSYLSWRDPRPFYQAATNTLERAYRKLSGRKARITDADRWKPSFNVLSSSRFSGLSPEFLSLLSERAKDYPFYTPQWFQNLAEGVAEASGEVQILCIADESGNAAAIIPLWIRTDFFHGVAITKASGLSNYYSPKIDVFTDDAYLDKAGAIDLAIGYLRKQKTKWHVLELSPLHYASCAELSKGKLLSFPYKVTSNYFHKLPGSFQAYLESRPSKLRHTILRKNRKINRAGKVVFEVKTGESDITSEIVNYHNVYTSSWKIDEPYPEFINGLIELSAAQGWLRLGTLKLDGKVIASQIWLVAAGKAYIYKLAYDKAYSQFSPGTVLTAKLIEHVMTEDCVRAFDFLLGSDTFKADWMDSRFDVYGIQYPNFRSLKGQIIALVNIASLVRKRMRRLI